MNYLRQIHPMDVTHFFYLLLLFSAAEKWIDFDLVQA